MLQSIFNTAKAIPIGIEIHFFFLIYCKFIAHAGCVVRSACAVLCELCVGCVHCVFSKIGVAVLCEMWAGAWLVVVCAEAN